MKWLAAKCAGSHCSSCFKYHVPWSLILCFNNQSTYLAAERNCVTRVISDVTSLRWGLCTWRYPFLVRCSPLPHVLSESSGAECTSVKHRIYSIRYIFLKDFCFIFSLRVFICSVLSWSSFPFLLLFKLWDSFPNKAIGVLENQSTSWGRSRESKLLLFEFSWWLKEVLICDSSIYTAALLGTRQNSWQLISFS